MQLDDKKRRLIVIGIALLLILMGAIQGLFKIKLDRKIVDEISFLLMMIAAWLLLSGRKTGKSANPAPKEEPNPKPENSSEEMDSPGKPTETASESSTKSN